MKELIWDKLRRQKLVWIAACLLSLCLGCDWVEVSTRIETSSRGVWWLIFYSAWIPGWLLELHRGYARVALTLPFTCRQLGRCLWLISVGLPTLVVAFFGGLGVLLGGMANSVSASRLFVLWGTMVLLAGLLFGSGFWVLNPFRVSGAKSRASQRWLGLTSADLYVCALIIFVIWLYYASYSHGTKYCIACLLALLFTVVGWYRAESLLVDYDRLPGSDLAEVKKVGRVHSPAGHGGLVFLLRRMVAGHFLVIFFCLAAVLIGSLWKSHGVNGSVATDACMIALLVCGVNTIGQVSLVASQPKSLRTLPLTGPWIAGLLLLITLAPFLFASLIISVLVGIGGGMSLGISACKASLMGLAPLCVLTVVLVWNSGEPIGRVVLTAILVSLSSAASVYQLFAGQSGLPLPFVVVYPLIFVVVSFCLLRKLIERDDLTYRARVHLGSSVWDE
jgi:hypothetical protein